MPVEYRCLWVWWKVPYDHGTSFLDCPKFPPLGGSGVEESRGAAIAARADRAGLGVKEVSRAWTQPAVRTGLAVKFWVKRVIWREFYQVCMRGKVVRGSTNTYALTI